MSQYIVLTAVGEDKPGIVDAVSRQILDCGCNIEDSRMAVLGGEFAMLILVSGEARGVEDLLGAVEALGVRIGLSISARRTRPPGAAAPAATVPYELTAHSLDHPGIVQRLAHHLAARQINIRVLDTRLSHAPVTGLPLFSIHAILDVPAQTHVAELRRELEGLGAQENIDVELRPAVKAG